MQWCGGKAEFPARDASRRKVSAELRHASNELRLLHAECLDGLTCKAHFDNHVHTSPQVPDPNIDKLPEVTRSFNLA